MKALEKTAIRGEANRKEVIKAIFSRPDKYDDMDEREPMERMADEMENFSKSILEMNMSQLEALQKVMRTILTLTEKMCKVEPEPVNVQIVDTRPLAWNIDVEKRDGHGRIEKISLTANKETIQ